MLRQRVMTAVLLGIPIIMAVTLLDTLYVALLFGLILLGATIEWSRLAGITSYVGRLVFLPMMAVGMMGLAYSLRDKTLIPGLLGLVSIGWVLLGVVLWRNRLTSPPLKAQGTELGRLLIGVLVLIPPWLAVVHLHASSPAGPLAVLYFLMLIWGVDTAAYFVGRRWGRNKLAPGISPAKTMEGVLGGVLGAGLLGLFGALGFGLGPAGGAGFMGLSMFTAMISVVGDLFESWMKRSSGVKDSGALLPGHGGLLDRIDSLTSAAPVFASGVLHFGLIP